MMLAIDKNDMVWQARLEGELTIYQAKDTYYAARELRGAAAPLELDLSAVNAIDSAGLQLLIMLRKHFSAHRQPLTMVACSDAVRDALEVCHLSEYLGLTSANSQSEAHP